MTSATNNKTTELLRCLENDYGIKASWDGLRKVWLTESAEPWNERAERTCRIVEYDEAPYPVCSECGAVQPDDFTVYYCWNCGSRVIG